LKCGWLHLDPFPRHGSVVSNPNHSLDTLFETETQYVMIF
jgi:hypothetical protein